MTEITAHRRWGLLGVGDAVGLGEGAFLLSPFHPAQPRGERARRPKPPCQVACVAGSTPAPAAMPVLSDETINRLRKMRGKLGYFPRRDDVTNLIDTIDHIRQGKPLPRDADLRPACKRYLEGLGATFWPSESWTIKGSDEGLDAAADWLASRVRAVLKEMHNK